MIWHKMTINGTISLFALLGMGFFSPSPAPSGRVNCIVDLPGGIDSALLLGGWDGSKWVSDKRFHSTVKGGERYRFYTLGRKIGEAGGSKPELSEASGDAWRITIKNRPAEPSDMIGMTGSWNPQPRTATVLRASPVYEQAVATLLKNKGIGGTKANITRIVKVDLDGDGSYEVIISAACLRWAENFGDASHAAQKGDYSFVILRRVRGGRAETDLLVGDFYPRQVKDTTPNLHEIAGVMDLNGDGRMEIVVRWQYFEGGGADVFDVGRGRPAKVLAAADGA